MSKANAEAGGITRIPQTKAAVTVPEISRGIRGGGGPVIVTWKGSDAMAMVPASWIEEMKRHREALCGVTKMRDGMRFEPAESWEALHEGQTVRIEGWRKEWRTGQIHALDAKGGEVLAFDGTIFPFVNNLDLIEIEVDA
jgi:hypothetical protein